MSDLSNISSPSSSGGGLTDAELRATPVPISGTVSVTEPVSIDDNGASLTVDGTVAVSNFPASQAVTGTFWQATQPVSIATAVPVTDNAGSLTVDGTVTAAAQPGVDIGDVTINNGSGAAAVNIQDGGNSITVDGTFWQATQPVSMAAGLAAGTNRIGSVRPVDSADADLTSAKLTQTSRFLGVQSSVDAGRTNLQFYATAVASGTTGTETAITLNRRPDTGAGTSAVSFVVTNGKRFRITSITFASRGHTTATAQVTTFSIRVNTAGAVTTTSTPIILQARCATPATSLAWDRFSVNMGNGLELTGDGTMQFGVTANAVFTTNAPTWDVLITGFEY